MDVLTAKMDLLAADIEVQELDETDTFVWLANKGLPANVLLTLEPLWKKTRKLGGRVISIGKIILFKIIEFIQNHPGTAIGIAFGGAIGALVNMIPFIGPMLAPVAMALGMVVMGTAGAMVDFNETSPFKAMIRLAMDFFATLADIFNTLKSQLLEG